MVSDVIFDVTFDVIVSFAADVVSADLTDVISSTDVPIDDVVCSAGTDMVETVVDDVVCSAWAGMVETVVDDVVCSAWAGMVETVVDGVVCSAWADMVETVVEEDTELGLVAGSTTFASSSSGVFGVDDVESGSAGPVTVVMVVGLAGSTWRRTRFPAKLGRQLQRQATMATR